MTHVTRWWPAEATRGWDLISGLRHSREWGWQGHLWLWFSMFFSLTNHIVSTRTFYSVHSEHLFYFLFRSCVAEIVKDGRLPEQTPFMFVTRRSLLCCPQNWHRRPSPNQGRSFFLFLSSFYLTGLSTLFARNPLSAPRVRYAWWLCQTKGANKVHEVYVFNKDYFVIQSYPPSFGIVIPSAHLLPLPTPTPPNLPPCSLKDS